MLTDRRGRKHTRTRLRLIALAFAVVACSDSTATTQQECTGDVAISATGGTTPTITWSPACRLWVLGVEEQDGGDVWVITSSGGNRIASGVRYGTLPSGAAALQPATPLVVGRTYSIFLARHTGPASDDGVLVGTADFTP